MVVVVVVAATLSANPDLSVGAPTLHGGPHLCADYLTSAEVSRLLTCPAPLLLEKGVSVPFTPRASCGCLQDAEVATWLLLHSRVVGYQPYVGLTGWVATWCVVGCDSMCYGL